MNSKKTLYVVALALSALLIAVGVSSAGSAPADRRQASAASPSVQVSAFKRAFHPTRRQARERAAIRRTLARAPKRAIAASADSSRARPASVAGSDSDVWIVPADGGAVCTVIPDPLDGYAISCATREDIAAGTAVTMLGGGGAGPLSDAAIVAVVVPDGGVTPEFHRPDGTDAEVESSANVAAAMMPLGSEIDAGAAKIVVPDAGPPRCDRPKPGESFRRCSL